MICVKNGPKGRTVELAGTPMELVHDIVVMIDSFIMTCMDKEGQELFLKDLPKMVRDYQSIRQINSVVNASKFDQLFGGEKE